MFPPWNDNLCNFSDDKIEEEPEVSEPEKPAKIEETAPVAAVEALEPTEVEVTKEEPAEAVAKEDLSEPELEKLVDTEEDQEPEAVQAAALNLVNNVFQTLDLEAAPQE